MRARRWPGPGGALISVLVLGAVAAAPRRCGAAPWSWRLGGEAEVGAAPRSALLLRYCCKGFSTARADLTVPPRSGWRIELQYSADCALHTTVRLTLDRGQELVLPLSHVERITRRCPLRRPSAGRMARREPLQVSLLIAADGGLGCCGSTRITRLGLLPAGADVWSPQRCGWLWDELRVALRDGMAHLVRMLDGQPL